MKKILAGCLVVTLIGVVGFGVAIYWGYRAAKPMIRSAGEYVQRARELGAIGDRIQNKAPFTPPEKGELTAAQVDRFLAVQSRVRLVLGDRWAELTAKSAALRKKAEANHGQDLSLPEVVSVFSDFTGIYMEARKAQVDALNVQKFSDDEYAWVRRRVYEAAGVQLAGGLDISAIEKIAKAGGANGGVQVPDLPKPDVPQLNLDLVKPQTQKLKELIPLAFLGL
jgi:hypothetical protein